MPAERVGALLHCPWHAVRTRQPIEVTIGILSRMKPWLASDCIR